MDAGGNDGLSPLLPFHLQDVILERLGPKHLANTSATNQKLRELAHSDRLWKSLFERRWGVHYFKLCSADSCPTEHPHRLQYGIEVTRPTLSVDPDGSCCPDQVYKTISDAISAAADIQSSRSDEQEASDHSDCDVECQMDVECQSSSLLPRIVVQPGCYDEQLAIEQPVEIVGAGRRPQDVVIQQQELVENGSSTLLKWKASEGLLCHLQLMQRLNGDGRSKAISIQSTVSPDREPVAVTLKKCDISSDGSGVDIMAATAEISECCIHHCGICGVSLAMADHSTIEDNFIVNNTDGILVWKSGGPEVGQTAAPTDGPPGV